MSFVDDHSEQPGDTPRTWPDRYNAMLAALDNATDGLMPESGGTFTGDVDMDRGTSQPIYSARRVTSGAEHRALFTVLMSGDVEVQHRTDNSIDGRVRLSNGEFRVMENFVVNGSKNAEIGDPDDEATAYRFAAVEADEAGLLVKRLRNVQVGSSREARIPVPEHFARIGADPMVFATYAQEPQGQTPHGPWAFVDGWDTGSPEVVLRAPQGVYHLLLTFCRTDAGVDGWEHVVTVDPTEPDEAA